MSYPAYEHFKGDRRKSLTGQFVYDWLTGQLDFLTPRDCKREWVAKETGIAGPHVSVALRWLVTHGYLKDHRVSKQDPRLLTLVHRLAPEHIVPECDRRKIRRKVFRERRAVVVDIPRAA